MPALRKKKVLVVGGGPAGMEAARVATLEGHEVVLYEKSNQLGGQINIATKIPTRHDFGEIASFLSRQLKKLNVKIVLGTEVTLDIVLEENPDAVVVATGAIPLRDDFSYLPADPSGIPGIGQENVVTFLEVLQEEVSVGEKVLLIDNTRLYDHYQAYGTTEFLADKGKRVEVVTSLLYGAPDLLLTHDLPFLYSRFAEKGITITPSTFVKEIKGNTVILYNVFSKDVRNVNDVDTIVLAVGNRANNALYKALKNKVSGLYAIGDCLSPRGVVVAIYEGNTVARKL